MAVIQPKQNNLKFLSDTLKILRSLHKNHLVVIEKPGSPIDKGLANLRKDKDKGFTLEFDDPGYYYSNLRDIEHLKVTTQNFTLHFEKVFLTNISLPKVEGNVSRFYTEAFSKQKPLYYRLFIPLKKKVDFHYTINNFHFETETHRSSQCIRISYKEVQLDLYLEKDETDESNYLILDCSQKLSYDEFSDYCFSSLVTFGYVTGKFPQDEGYYFGYEKADLKVPKHVFFTEFRDTMNSMYSPVYRNAYGYIRDHAVAEAIQPSLRALTLKEFSQLCQWCHRSVDFSSILLLIIEATTSSLLVMPSGLSVALEGLTDILVQGKQDAVAPIPEKKLAGKIRAELKGIVDKYAENLSEDGKKILKIRIEQINQVTNRTKLIKPFELLNFKLSAEDVKAIEHRNDFLHGRVSLAFGDEVDKANVEIYYISLRLYTLLAVLILKSVGYDNKIVNYPKIHESVYKKNLDEPYFRQV